VWRSLNADANQTKLNLYPGKGSVQIEVAVFAGLVSKAIHEVTPTFTKDEPGSFKGLTAIEAGVPT